MAIAIAYGIGFATVLTLVILPIFLSFSNWLKANTKWLITGENVTKEEVERAIKEQKEEEKQNLPHIAITESKINDDEIKPLYDA